MNDENQRNESSIRDRDRPCERGGEKTDGSNAQAFPDTVPANDTARPEAVVTTGCFSMLLPSTATDLMKLVNDTPAQKLSSTALSQHDWPVCSMKMSRASTAPAPKAGEPNYYSQNDLDTIKATTGIARVVSHLAPSPRTASPFGVTMQA